MGFIVDLPNRQSFCPDAAWYVGEMTMKFLEGPPVLAVEVRSEGDYGPAAEEAMALKRIDYFDAGVTGGLGCRSDGAAHGSGLYCGESGRSEGLQSRR